MSEKTKFIHIHVPRSGGTSFFRIISSLFQGVRREGLSSKNIRNANIISGHFDVDKYADLGYPNITIIRDPVDRVVSDYFNDGAKGYNRRYGGKFVNHGDEYLPSLLKFAETKKNIYTKMLKDLSRFEFVGLLENWKESIKRFEEWSGVSVPLEAFVTIRNSSKRPALPVFSDVIYQIREINAKDYEIYEEVKKVYGYPGIPV